VVHSSAKERTVTPSPQPSKPAPVRKLWTWVIVAVVAVVVWIVIASNRDQPADPQAAPAPAPTGAAAILRAAGPLHAHIENTNQLICDPSTATIAQSGRGFRIHVDYQGPGNLTVAATSVDKQDASESYTIGAQESGHDFAFAQFPLSKVQVASVSVTAAAGGGSCDVVDHMP
jgi:hypothetical protein